MTEVDYTKDTGARPSGSPRYTKMKTVRVDIRTELLDELMRDANGASLTTLLNSALKVGLVHKEAIIRDASYIQNAKVVRAHEHSGNFERA